MINLRYYEGAVRCGYGDAVKVPLFLIPLFFRTTKYLPSNGERSTARPIPSFEPSTSASTTSWTLRTTRFDFPDWRDSCWTIIVSNRSIRNRLWKWPSWSTCHLRGTSLQMFLVRHFLNVLLIFLKMDDAKVAPSYPTIEAEQTLAFLTLQRVGRLQGCAKSFGVWTWLEPPWCRYWW